MRKKFKVIANPTAGSYAVSKNWTKVETKLIATLGDLSVEFTQAKDHATKLTRRAIEDGFETIIAVGGDGTINEVVNGFFENGCVLNSETRLSFIPMGTGADWVRSVGSPNQLNAAIELILRGQVRKCDAGILQCQAFDGTPRTRYFMNIADAGFGGELAGRVNQSTKRFGSFVSYLVGLLKTLAIYKNRPVRIQVDDDFYDDRIINSVVVANGQYFGGGMWIAPNARTDDGLFELVIIGDVSRREALANINRLYKGTLALHPKVTTLTGRKVRLESESEVLIEADGEVSGKLPATFEVLPRALQIIA
ncbi:diacylglycerol kinase family lipid kinase [bacterium]|nr:diacylglycerol kinase family lipid kinase [bacterium]